jgi:hypothetical protein
MRIRMWAVVLLSVAFLPAAVHAQAAKQAAALKAPAAKVEVVAVAPTALEDAGITPCHLNLATPMASPTYPGFGPSFLVRNGGACTDDSVCASKWCVNHICKQLP